MRLGKFLESIDCGRIRYMERNQRVWELIDVADCVVTKAGGMVSFECFYKKTIPVFVQAHPGQERANANILTSSLHFGFWAHSLDETIKIIEALKDKALPTETFAKSDSSPFRSIEAIKEYIYTNAQ